MPAPETGRHPADPASAPRALNKRLILAALTADARQLLDGLEIHREIDSTNSYLMRRSGPDAETARVCLAEMQTAGRGRRGRDWVSPFGASLYLSLSRRFVLPPACLVTLSPLSAIAVARALRTAGIEHIALKWPNDLYAGERKLGGILLENSAARTVIGIGVNVAMPTHTAIAQPWTDLQTILGHSVCRNKLAAGILNELLPSLAAADARGIPPVSAAWAEFDAYAGREITVQLPAGNICGRAHGIDECGALRVQTATGMHHFRIGEVSLRARP